MRHNPYPHTALFLLLLSFALPSYSQLSRADSIQEGLHLDSLTQSEVNRFTRKGFEYILEDTDSALAHLAVALEGAKQLNDAALINNAAYWMARTYMIRGEDTESFLYGHMALSSSEQAQDSGRIARSYSLLGIAYKSIRDLDKALEYHQQALAFYRSDQNLKKIGTELNNLGLIFEEQGDLEGAERVYQEAYQLKIQAKDVRGQAYVKGNLANIAFERGRFEEAARLCDELVLEAGDPRLKDILSEALSLRADIALRQGNLQKAIASVEQAIPLIDELKAPALRHKLLNIQYQIYKKEGNLKAALAYLEESTTLADSLAEAESLELMANLTLQRERKEKALLGKEVELAKARTESAGLREKWTQIGAITLLVAAITVILLVFRNQQREHHARLQIESQARQLQLLNHEIHQQSQQLANHSRVKDKILSLIAHDLRSPLASLGELLDMLHEGRLPEDKFMQLTRTLRARMASIGPMLVNLLEWASYQIKSYEPQKTKADLSELATNSLNLFENVARAKSINLSLEMPLDLNAYVDPGMMQLALRNLISNALKFTPIGGSVKVEGRLFGDKTHVTVSDTGIGMTEAEQALLFSDEHFTMPGTEEEQGAGLGLLLVRDFVKQNEGQIEVQSTPGKGSSFTLIFQTHPQTVPAER